MSSFTEFAKANSSRSARKQSVLCRLWERQVGFTSGSTTAPVTYWVEGNKLLRGNGINLPLAACKDSVPLTEGSIKAFDSDSMEPVLRGTIDGAEIIVRANTLAQKQAQVDKSKEKGNVEASLSRQPDLYIQVFTYSLENVKPQTQVQNAVPGEIPLEEMGF